MDARIFEILRLPYDNAPAPRADYLPEEHNALWLALIAQYNDLASPFFGPDAFTEIIDEGAMTTNSKHSVSTAGLLNITPAMHVMYTTLPKLSEKGVEQFRRTVGSLLSQIKEDNLPFVMAATASLIFETRLASRKFPKIESSDYWHAVNAEIASYAVWLNAAIARDQTAVLVDHAIDDFRERAGKLIGEEQDRRNSMSESVIALQERHAALQTMFAESQEQIRSSTASYKESYDTAASFVRQIDAKAREIDQALTTNDENLQAFRTAAYAALEIDSTRRLWDARAKSNLYAFIGSALLIAVFLVVIPMIALSNLELVVSALERVGEVTVKGLPQQLDGAQLTLVTISRLIVISVPLALYFWIVKLLVRFNMRSLLLMDDAAQRHTMMDTYFRLIDRDAATTNDRALILNALFRPLPGSAPESVEPPNFTELIDRATGKS